jgi:hypothetical protein
MTTYRNQYPVGYYVYAYIRNKSSNNGPAGSPYYIGKGKGPRAWVKHHTPQDPTYIIIIEENLTEIGALAIERRLIKWYGRIDVGNGILRNRTDGGEGLAGLKLSPEQRQTRRNRKNSPETRKKISMSNKGRRLSMEHRKKMSLIAQARIPSPKWKEGFSGKKHSDAAREKIRQSSLEQQWYHNSLTENMFKDPPGPEWQPGRLPNKMLWWNNGQLVKRAINAPGPDWVKGRLHGTRGTSGMKYYNNGTEQKLFLTDPGTPWQLGKLPVLIHNRL